MTTDYIKYYSNVWTKCLAPDKADELLAIKKSQFNISGKSELLVKNVRAELKEPDCVEVNWETPLTDSYTFQY